MGLATIHQSTKVTTIRLRNQEVITRDTAQGTELTTIHPLTKVTTIRTRNQEGTTRDMAQGTGPTTIHPHTKATTMLIRNREVTTSATGTAMVSPFVVHQRYHTAMERRGITTRL